MSNVMKYLVLVSVTVKNTQTDNQPQTGKYKFSCWVRTDGLSSGKASLNIYSKKEGDNTHTSFPSSCTPSSVSLQLTNTNGKWKYFELIINLDDIRKCNGVSLSQNLSLRAFISNSDSQFPIYIDDIRFHPLNSLMTTTTYDRFNGKTSVTNARNITTFYEYDSLGRLKYIRDNDGNITKKMTYKFLQK